MRRATHGDTEIVSQARRGRHPPLHLARGRACARASSPRRWRGSAARPGDRVGTLAWNGYRHLEIYYGTSGSELVCHTINPRLFPEQIAWIANDAEDRVLFFDLDLPAAGREAGAAAADACEHFVLHDRPGAHAGVEHASPDLLCYEDLVDAEDGSYDWPEFDENTASSICYTSGTTGNPKGAVYSHRSTLLHAFGAALPDAMDCRRARRRSCRWCRCSTSTPGACRTRRR